MEIKQAGGCDWQSRNMLQIKEACSNGLGSSCFNSSQSVLVAGVSEFFDWRGIGATSVPPIMRIDF
ncbi:hypothetical protein N7465_002541 [Penicillium sp. CMV-2018d]|nr:hypothetical protein N7465_002541 [Penicillium sp. CMV-2018d]